MLKRMELQKKNNQCKIKKPCNEYLEKRNAIMSISIKEAEAIVNMMRDRWISLGRNPETLYLYDNHIKGCAIVAQTIALKLGNIDSTQMYVSAFLHDIAKIDESPESMVGRFHGILGYEKFKDIDQQVARACLLHELPWNSVKLYEKKFLGNKDDYNFVSQYVKDNPLKDEDLLVQLADAMANKNGIVTLKQRQQEYEERFNKKLPDEMITPYIEIKQYFDKKINGNVYDLFPNLKSQKFNSTQISSFNTRNR